MLIDLEQRGHDEKPRKMTITLTGEKKDGDIFLDVEVKLISPAYRTGPTVCTLVERGGRYGKTPVLLFQELDPENPNQDTLDKHMPRDGAAE
jgi:hypothetical protein